MEWVLETVKNVNVTGQIILLTDFVVNENRNRLVAGMGYRLKEVIACFKLTGINSGEKTTKRTEFLRKVRGDGVH